MAWSDSRIFQAWIDQPMMRDPAQTSPTGGTGEIKTNDAVKVTLFNNTTTPSRTAAVASTGYNTGVWVTANEVTSGTDWVAAGIALSGKNITASAGVVNFSATNITSTATATLTAYGLLVYDDTITGGTVAKQGICYLYFGGAQTVTSGSFSVNWNASGLMTFTT
jgi:hypothetical protein